MTAMHRRSAWPLLVLGVALAAPAGVRAQALELRYGVASFGDVDPLKEVETLASCGCDYVEPGLAKTAALAPDALREARRRLGLSTARVEAMNWFVPADIKLTGPDVDRARIRAYLEPSLALAAELGAKVIVFGSPGARSYPEGFSRQKAWAQLREFLTEAGGIIASRNYDLVIGIEHLRKPETNIVNSVAEAARLAREVNHPAIRLTVDFYHLAFENEDPDVILQARDLIVHLQIADPKERGFPRDEAGEPRYGRFFANLRAIGYRGRISIEANSSNLGADCRAALAFLEAMTAKYGR
jgi:D-psicose/D-tagatose/L-ribulose 3-epimerase